MVNGKRFLFTLTCLVVMVGLAVPISLLVAQTARASTITWNKHLIDGDFGGAISVNAVDLDEDGDTDLLAAGYGANQVAWFENDGEQNFTKHIVDGNSDGAERVCAADVDLDGDVDILGAARRANVITWYENDGSENFAKHIVDGDSFGAAWVFATDLDGDGDIDVLGSAFYANAIAWHENDGNENFAKHIIDGGFNGAQSVYALDFDKDGDKDVLVGAFNSGEVAWCENDGNQSFTKRIIDSSFSGAQDVYAADVDGDGDIDVLGAASYANQVALWENNGRQSFNKHVIDSGVVAASVYAADVDGDGDFDMLMGSDNNRQVKWYENEGNLSFIKHVIDNDFYGCHSVSAADVDGDGDMDVVGGAVNIADVAWWENNQAPVANAQAVTTDEDTAKAIILTAKDVDGDAITYSVVVPPAHGVLSGTAPALTYTPAFNYSGSDSFTFKANDGKVDSNIATVSVTVNPVNDAPILGPIYGPVGPVNVVDVVQVNAAFSDPDILDTHIATWDWGDNTFSDGVIVESGGSGSVSGTHTYNCAGVYALTLTLRDNGGLSATSRFEFVVVYNPDGGFVTGGGWINSPVGAYAPDPTMTGKATFGFVSKYQKGATMPTGQTEFHFKVANLNFHSDSYIWLVIAGPKAQYKGEGKINGEGRYSFMLTTVDGDLLGGCKPDTFRIKIWNKDTGEVIYDNQLEADDNSDPTTPISGGNIIIHK